MRLPILIAAALFYLTPCAAANNSIEFSHEAVMQIAQQSLRDLTFTGPRSRMHMDSENRRWWEEDCARYSAERSGAIEYEPTRLTSREYIEYCRDVDVEDSDGHHHHERRCHTEYGRSVSRDVQLKIEERIIFPWEQERFFFCLKRDELRFGISAAAYKYDKIPSQIPGYPPLNVMTLHPLKKTPMPPDSEGLSISEAGSVEGVARIKLADKWWQEYKAFPEEKTVITFRLVKKGFLVSGPTYEETLEFSPAETYSFEFNAADYQLESGKYYFQCSFTRLGKISTSDSVDMEKSKTFLLRLK
ncbi:MAG TPA: hypothetical protein PLL10_06205 [Elusimicrobiales bacterium]|nr:hypothetical protein [Elusimicrobiales bacterium]